MVVSLVHANLVVGTVSLSHSLHDGHIEGAASKIEHQQILSVDIVTLAIADGSSCGLVQKSHLVLTETTVQNCLKRRRALVLIEVGGNGHADPSNMTLHLLLRLLNDGFQDLRTHLHGSNVFVLTLDEEHGLSILLHDWASTVILN